MELDEMQLHELLTKLKAWDCPEHGNGWRPRSYEAYICMECREIRCDLCQPIPCQCWNDD